MAGKSTYPEAKTHVARLRSACIPKLFIVCLHVYTCIFKCFVLPYCYIVTHWIPHKSGRSIRVCSVKCIIHNWRSWFMCTSKWPPPTNPSTCNNLWTEPLYFILLNCHPTVCSFSFFIFIHVDVNTRTVILFFFLNIFAILNNKSGMGYTCIQFNYIHVCIFVQLEGPSILILRLFRSVIYILYLFILDRWKYHSVLDILRY